MRAGVFVSVIILAVIGAVSAQAADKRWCQGVSDYASDETLRLARIITKAKRVNFVSNPGDTAKTAECPSMSAHCQNRAFLVPGDQVLVDEIEGDFACVSFVSARGSETGGWVPKDAVEAAPPASPRLQDWAGAWTRTEASIKLELKSGKIDAAGDASWGSRDPVRVRNGAVHIGGFAGSAVPQGNRLAYGEGYDGKGAPDRDNFECQVLLRLFGRYLLVDDNSHCGGANVSFSGVYVRKAQ
jgi:hypothetical protein